MNRHVVVTGAGSGIGLQIALRFADLGEELTLVDISEPALGEAAKKSEARGASAVSIQSVDLRTPQGPGSMIDKAWDVAPIDVLINSAGVYPSTPFLSLDVETWNSVLDLNTRAPMLATVALARRAVSGQRGASVVNISSSAAQRARPGAAPYSTSKAALEMLTRASALELAGLS